MIIVPSTPLVVSLLEFLHALPSKQKVLTGNENVRTMRSAALNMFSTITPKTVLFLISWPLRNRSCALSILRIILAIEINLVNGLSSLNVHLYFTGVIFQYTINFTYIRSNNRWVICQ